MLRRSSRPALLLVLAAVLAASLPLAASAQQQEQRQLERARAELSALRAEIEGAASDAEDADEALADADATLRELEAIVNEVAGQVERQRAAVRDAERRLAGVEADAQVLTELFADRVARMYKLGPDLTFEIMFGADSAEEAMARTSLLTRVAESEQVDLEQLEVARVAVDAERQRLAAEEGRLERMLVEQQQLLEEADALRESRALAAADARAQLDALNRQHDDLEAEEAELQDTIRRIQEEERRRQEEQRRAEAARRSSGGSPSAEASSSGHRWPACGPVTSEFGPRWGRVHRGIDLGVPTGTPIAASKAGTVIFAGSQGGYGNLVLVDHHDGLVTAYAHLSSFRTSVGQSVSQGQTVALSGNTGNSTGPHLHFETRANGTAVNPRQYLSGSPC